MNALGAYYGDATRKTSAINNLISHAERGEFTNGHYFESQSNTGCAIGCAMNSACDSDDYGAFQRTFNMPAFVAHFMEDLFAGLGRKERKNTMLVAAYMSNIPVGFCNWDRFWILAAGHMLRPFCENPKQANNLWEWDNDVRGTHTLFKYIMKHLTDDPHLTAHRVFADLKNAGNHAHIDLSLSNMMDLFRILVPYMTHDIDPYSGNLFYGINHTMKQCLALGILIGNPNPARIPEKPMEAKA